MRVILYAVYMIMDAYVCVFSSHLPSSVRLQLVSFNHHWH